ncbi:phasin family protein [Pseudomonas aeruginosa]
MAGKKKSEKESSWIGEIEKYSRQIWLAGLGAYSKVSKDGSKLFETLVKDGEKAEKKRSPMWTRRSVRRRLPPALRRARSTRFGTVRSASGASSRKLSTSA